MALPQVSNPQSQLQGEALEMIRMRVGAHDETSLLVIQTLRRMEQYTLGDLVVVTDLKGF